MLLTRLYENNESLKYKMRSLRFQKIRDFLNLIIYYFKIILILNAITRIQVNGMKFFLKTALYFTDQVQ